MARKIPYIRVRGIRQTMPTGVFVGRGSKGNGRPEMMSIAQVRQLLGLSPGAVEQQIDFQAEAAITAYLDGLSDTHGAIIFRGDTAWEALEPSDDGKVLTTHDEDNDPTWETPSGGGSGAAWTLTGTGQTATGVYDQAVDGSKSNIDFAGLGNANELLIIARGLTSSVSGNRAVTVSVDGGSTFYTASGDYQTVSATGVEANTTVFGGHSTASASARGFVTHILNMKGTHKAAIGENNTSNTTMFVASASDINAIRINNLGGGNITGGTVRVYAR